MEIIGMEANAYEKSIRELNQFLDRIDRLLESTSPKTIGEWIDNQEACSNIERISPDTAKSERHRTNRIYPAGTESLLQARRYPKVYK